MTSVLLEEVLREKDAEIDALRVALVKLERENKRLADELTVLLNRLFRKKSERLDPAQLRLLIEELTASGTPAPLPAAEPKSVPVKAHRRGHGRAAFPPHLPRETIELDVAPEERICPDCGQEMQAFGVETTERGHIIPARLVVKQYVRKKYACPGGHAVRTAALPPSLIEKCKYEPSVYAQLVVAKYGDHLPLHRLSGIYKRQGFVLPKSTMWEMLRRVDEIVAAPILRQMRQELLTEPLLQADETPVIVQLEDERKSHKGYIWDYGIGKKRVFQFTLTRERDGPRQFLSGWRGTLQTDGYSGYDEVIRVNQLVRAGCWSHARRKLKEALDTGARESIDLIRPVQRLFRIERALHRRAEAEELTPDAWHELRLDVRRRLSARVLARIQTRVQALSAERSTLPKSKLGQALTYLDNQWVPLTRFLDDPALEIHNNDSERALRHVVTGRKNWLFFGSPEGARVGANLFSLVATCKALEINPQAYLEDVIQRVDHTPASRIAELTPWAWAEE
jgi:transposase